MGERGRAWCLTGSWIDTSGRGSCELVDLLNTEDGDGGKGGGALAGGAGSGGGSGGGAKRGSWGCDVGSLIGAIRWGTSGGGGGKGQEGGGGGGGGPSDGGGGCFDDDDDDDSADGDKIRECAFNVAVVEDKLNGDLPESELGPVGGRRLAAQDVSTPFPFGPDGGKRAFTMLLLLEACGTCPFMYELCFPPPSAPPNAVCDRGCVPFARLRGPVGGVMVVLGAFVVGEVDVLAPGVDVSGVESVAEGGNDAKSARGPRGGAFPVMILSSSPSPSSRYCDVS